MSMAFLCAHFELFGHQEWGMVRDRLNSLRSRNKRVRQPMLSKKQSARRAPMRTASSGAADRKQLDGPPQGQPSLPMGINVRLVGARNASANTAGKEYVELLG